MSRVLVACDRRAGARISDVDVKVLEPVFAAVPVAFNGGPLNRQVHVWSRADVAASEAVWVGDDRSGGYVRARTWRTQQRNQRPVTYAWTKLRVGDFMDMPALTVSVEHGSRP